MFGKMFYKCLLVFLVGVCACRALPEGAECTHGDCFSVYKCYTFLLNKTEEEPPPFCSEQVDEPTLCCTECPEQLVANKSNAVFTHRMGLMWLNGRTSWQTCVDYARRLPYLHKHRFTRHQYFSASNVTSACPSAAVKLDKYEREDTRKGEYPFMLLETPSLTFQVQQSFLNRLSAVLGYGDDWKAAQWLCGGTLISSWAILTAAHCISKPEIGPIKFVSVGLWVPSAPGRQWQIYGVANITPHPDYKPPSRYHDIALVFTEKPVEFNYGTLPACLPSEPKRDPSATAKTGEEYALGWGPFGPGQHLAHILRKVNLRKVSDGECTAIFSHHRHLQHGYNGTTQMCYKSSDGPARICEIENDSGGPVVRPSEASPDVKTVIGVTSYGMDCERADTTGLYTRVEPYLPWIESVILHRMRVDTMSYKAAIPPEMCDVAEQSGDA